MDQNIQKALWLGVGIMLFVAIVSVGLHLFNKGKEVANAGGEQLDSISEKLAMTEYEPFDNNVVKGDMLVNTIKQHKKDGGKIMIVVTTSRPSTTQYISTGGVSNNVLSGNLSGKTVSQTDSDIQQVIDETSNQYINPHGDFMCQLIYDSNDAVKGIVATQQN